MAFGMEYMNKPEYTDFKDAGIDTLKNIQLPSLNHLMEATFYYEHFGN